MQVTPSALQSINVGFNARFKDAYGQAEPQVAQLAMQVPSAHRANTYGWMLRIPRLREWIGDRLVQNLMAASYTLVNRPFELTVGVDRDDIEDDQIGVYNPFIDMIGQQAKLWPDDLVYEVLRAGDQTLCWDGQYFFDSDHPTALADGTVITQANLLSGMPLTVANYFEARRQFRQFVGEDGRRVRANPTHLVVPAGLEKAALEILNATMINNTTNVAANTAQLIVLDDLDSDADWYLADLSKPIKPFVFQLRKAPEFVMMDSPDNENVFRSKEFLYGVDSRGNAGYALWFLAMKVRAA